jgi:hypothetical protein
MTPSFNVSVGVLDWAVKRRKNGLQERKGGARLGRLLLCDKIDVLVGYLRQGLTDEKVETYYFVYIKKYLLNPFISGCGRGS